MSLRVHELAKELKLTSKELIDKLKSLRIKAKSHMSVLADEDTTLIRKSLKASSKPASAGPLSSKSSAVKLEKPQTIPSLESVKREIAAGKSQVRTSFEPRIPFKRPAPSPPKPSPFSKPDRIVVSPPKPRVEIAQETAKRPVEEARKEPPAPAERFEPLEPKAPPEKPQPSSPPPAKKVEIRTPIVVKELAGVLGARPNELIERLISIGIFANINQSLNFDVASRAAGGLGFELVESERTEGVSAAVRGEVKDKKGQVWRAPIVTFMGHVDHGKTSLLDAIRKTKVAAQEAGGITQHIGAYQVFLPKGAVTFLDTPGHEAFTAMRARGARVTDVVVLVVAADDSVMPQTVEAIDHAKAAGVPIVVAINKMDLPAANPDRVKRDLMAHGLMPEELGGKTVMVGVSAKTGQGIDELLEMLALESELLELRADPSAASAGVVIEAELSRERGILATLLVQDGTLRVGDPVVAGACYGKVRAMVNDRGQRIKEALPSTPVEVMGLSDVPQAGDGFYIMKDERRAREIIEEKQRQIKERGRNGASHITLEHLYEKFKEGKVQELKLILKSDVQGSLEALRTTLAKIPSKNVQLNVLHAGTGDVSESDVMLAAASDAVVIGFHVGISQTAKEAGEREKVDVRFYEIIYEAQASIQKAMEGLLEPELKEVLVGTAEVRQVFKVSKMGAIAGCSVQKGKIVRNFACRVVRDGQKIHEGKIGSLKRFKEDARDVSEGFECGISVSGFDDYHVGDRIEVFEIQKFAQKLE
ncbi:MAG: translation initiation factor IF-2 [Candidatus Omnitrophica bacterium]|nr:translation initiation factor IF-2 [Candidatus Omnitrophota bacterium]